MFNVIQDLCEYPFELLNASDQPVVIDTETAGWTEKKKKQEEEKPNSFVKAPEAIVIYFSWTANDIPAGAGSTLTERGMKFFEALCACKRPKICHNLKADKTFARNTGIEIQNVQHDTIIGHALLDEYDEDFHALKPLSRRLFSDARSDEYELENLQKQYPSKTCNYNVLITRQDVLHKYSLQDAVSTLRLFNWEMPQLIEQGLMDTYTANVAAEHAYLEVEWRGVKIDIITVEETLQALVAPIGEVLRAFWHEAKEEINPRSYTQLAPCLLRNGVPLRERNDPSATEIEAAKLEGREPIGSLKTDHSTLQPFSHMPVIQYLFAYRFLTKSQSTLKNYKRQIDANGRAHPIFHQLTVTGRSGCSGIPLQQIPKTKGKLTEIEVGNKELAERCANAYRLVRAAFIAEEGAWLNGNDYKQIEYYVAAHYSGSKRLIDILNSGIDFHEMTCKLVFGYYDDNLRNLIKIINYGILYGMGVPLLSIRIRAYTDENPLSILRRYEQNLPEMRQLQSVVKKAAMTRGYVTDVFGRRYHFKRESPHSIVAYLCQGTAAQIKKRSMSRVHTVYKEANAKSGIVMDIHDDIVQEVYPEDAYLLPSIKTTMEDYPQFDVPIKVDTSVGKDLLKMKTMPIEECVEVIQGKRVFTT